MKTYKTILTSSSEKTKLAAQDFSKKLKPGDFIALYGDLGSGKTTFVQGIMRGLGVKKRIISPSFIIAREYKVYKNNIKNVYHIDLYRTETLKDVEGLGIEEIIENKKSVVVLEWPERMSSLLPLKRWEVYFTNLGNNKREVLIKNK